MLDTHERKGGETFVRSTPHSVFVNVKRAKFTLEQAVKSQRGSKGVALFFLYPRH